MGGTPNISMDELRMMPLFDGFTDAQLSAILALCEPIDGPGILFDEDETAEALYLLEKGEVVLSQNDEDTHELYPPAIIGELGALTSRTRNSRARASEDAVVWRIATPRLLELFETDKDLGLGFQQNLMHIVAEKIDRDQKRIHDMRANIIRTQKAMKSMRDFLLESEDTVVSKRLHEIVEGLIRKNRRVNYRVRPPESLPASLRLDDATRAAVAQISRTHISYRVDNGVTLPFPGDRVSAVLSLSGPEIPVSGKVLRTIDRRVDVELDLMVDEYIQALEGYLTRLQMLDFLV